MYVLTDLFIGTRQAARQQKSFRLNHGGKNVETKAGSLNIPWRGDWSYFH